MILYLDTSSLVKLYVEEDGSDQVRALTAGVSAVATSAVAYPEARAAFARLRREAGLTPAALTRVKRRLDEHWPSYLVVSVTLELSHAAGDLAERHALRGFDALHLASFASIYRLSEDQVQFSSFDDRLNRAANTLLRQLNKS